MGVLGNPEEVAMSENNRKVIDVLRNAKEPMGPKDIAGAVGCDETAVSMALGRLATKGIVEKTGRGKWRADEDRPRIYRVLVRSLVSLGNRIIPAQSMSYKLTGN